MKCDNCGKDIGEKVYYWQGLSPVYCSPTCAAWGCPNAMLHYKNNKCKITRDEFERYEEVRVSGRTNMLAVHAVSALSGLCAEKIRDIIKNYGELKDKYIGGDE